MRRVLWTLLVATLPFGSVLIIDEELPPL